MHDLGEKTEVRIEVEDSPPTVLIVLDRERDMLSLPWQDAFRLCEVIEQVIEDHRDSLFKPTSVYRTRIEQTQLTLNHAIGVVYICLNWSDRLKFTSLDALYVVSQALRKMTQDAMLAERGVFFRYTDKGFIKSVHNTKLDTVQRVR